MSIKLKEIWEKYETKIVTSVGMLLIAVISFEVGMIKGGKWQQDPLIVETPKETVAMCENGSFDRQVLASKSNNDKLKDAGERCLFVGSKNSDKYHSLDCHWAERIKEDNRICFSSVKEAENKGYSPGSCLK